MIKIFMGTDLVIECDTAPEAAEIARELRSLPAVKVDSFVAAQDAQRLAARIAERIRAQTARADKASERFQGRGSAPPSVDKVSAQVRSLLVGARSHLAPEPTDAEVEAAASVVAAEVRRKKLKRDRQRILCQSCKRRRSQSRFIKTNEERIYGGDEVVCDECRALSCSQCGMGAARVTDAKLTACKTGHACGELLCLDCAKTHDCAPEARARVAGSSK